MTIKIGCNCGKAWETKTMEPDPEYGQYYVMMECDDCDYYWEGYYGYIP